MNRNPIKQWFITFPQVGEVEDKLNFHTKLPPSQWSLTCQEEHRDGGKHLHICIILKKGISHSKLCKWLEVKYPNDWKRIHFKPVKFLKDAIAYCNKEDPSSLEIGQQEIKRTKYTIEDAENDVMNNMLYEARDRRMISEGKWQLERLWSDLEAEKKEKERLIKMGFIL